MSPAIEARLLALATIYGMMRPRIIVAPTTGRGSKSYRKGVEVTVREETSDYISREVRNVGATEDVAAEALCADLAHDARGRIAAHRSMAVEQAAHADRLEAALTAAIATGGHAPACPAPTEVLP